MAAIRAGENSVQIWRLREGRGRRRAGRWFEVGCSVELWDAGQLMVRRRAGGMVERCGSRRTLTVSASRFRHRDGGLRAIHDLAAALHARTTPDEALRQTLQTAISTVAAGGGSILLYDPKKERLVFKYVVNDDPAVIEMLMQIELRPDQGIPGHVFQEGRGRITLDTSVAGDMTRASTSGPTSPPAM